MRKLIFFALLFAGCTSWDSYREPTKTWHTFKDFDVGEIKVSNVGEPMVSIEKALITDVGQFEVERNRTELVYSGNANGIINLLYREFSNTRYGQMARPAFDQNLTYDLNKSKVIRFRELEIEVIDAMNDIITFRVLEDGLTASR